MLLRTGCVVLCPLMVPFWSLCAIFQQQIHPISVWIFLTTLWQQCVASLEEQHALAQRETVSILHTHFVAGAHEGESTDFAKAPSNDCQLQRALQNLAVCCDVGEVRMLDDRDSMVES